MTHMTLQAVRQLIANDSYAITFQSLGQYRTALLRHFDSLVEAPITTPAEEQRAAFEAWHHRHFSVAAHRAQAKHGGNQLGLEYWSDYTNNSWAGWQAALAAHSQGPRPTGEFRTCCDHPDCSTCAGRGGYYRLAAKGEAPAPQWGRVDTVGDMVRNLLTLDQATPIFTGHHVDIDGKRRCRTRPVTISRERVVDGKWIDPARKDVPYANVVWAKPDERAQQAAAPGALPGYKLVPLEPTPEMQQAGFNTPGAHMYNASYRAMVAAAPGTPEAPAGTDAKDAARYQWLRVRWVAWREADGASGTSVYRKREKLDEWIDRAAQLDGGQGEERSNVCRPAT